jgi:Zn ribbon nucleic-acid-binding protein
MDNSKYWPPPSGVRKPATLQNGDVTRRDPENGPYGVFITKVIGISKCCRPRERDDYMAWWNRATLQMRKCLWYGQRERESAKRVIRRLNEEIRTFNTTHGREEERGMIDESDWSNAGRQLDLAIRDKCLYNSTARFEDVRDFIWERIQNRLYPAFWEVKWEDFKSEIEKRRPNFENIRNGNEIDKQDGAFRFYERSITSTATSIMASTMPQPESSLRNTQRTATLRNQNTVRRGLSMQARAGISRPRVNQPRSRRQRRNFLEDLETRLR